MRRFRLTSQLKVSVWGFVLLTLAGCGGSNNDDRGTTAGQSGVFIDSPVKGLVYSSGSLSGVTGANGTPGSFRYRTGKLISFRIDCINLGSVTGKATITPRDLGTTENARRNIARLLLSLDSDGNNSNGIDVSNITCPTGLDAVNFDLDPLDFKNQSAAFASFILASARANTRAGTSNGELVSATYADTHLNCSLEDLAAGRTPDGICGATPAISINDVSADEGATGTTTFEFTVSLSAETTDSVTVDYVTADGTAEDGSPAGEDNDYVATSGTLTFDPGQTSKAVNVVVNGDADVEPSETFFVNLGNVSATATIADDQGVGTILNDDSAPGTSTLSMGDDVSALEGNDGSRTFAFVVRRGGETNMAVSVKVTTSDGSAKADDGNNDYEALVPNPTTLNFTVGQTEQIVNVTVNGDTVVENDEFFTVSLSSPSPGASIIGDGQAIGTIKNDDEDNSLLSLLAEEGPLNFSACVPDPTSARCPVSGIARTLDPENLAKCQPDPTVNDCVLSKITGTLEATADPFDPNTMLGEDFANVAGMVVPPGTDYLHPTVDLDAYDQLVYDYHDRAKVEAGLTSKYFKNARFNNPNGGWQREYSPKNGLTIRRDAKWGVPYVYGKTDELAWFGAGYVNAEDRLPIMEALRALGRAEVFEVAGTAAAWLADAEMVRLYGYTQEELHQQVERVIEIADEEEGQRARAAIDNYVDGINAYVVQVHNGVVPTPTGFADLGIQPSFWSAEDVVAAATLVRALFGAGGGGEMANAAFFQTLLARYGGDVGKARTVYEDFRNRYNLDGPMHTLDPSFAYLDRPANPNPAAHPMGFGAGTPGLQDQLTQLASGSAINFAALKLDLPLGSLDFSRPGSASNALLVGGSRTVDGHPIQLAGPQTGYFAPEILMEMELHSPGMHTRGSVFPGLGFVPVIGRAANYGWSATAGGSDMIDTFVEKLCEPNGGTPTEQSHHYLHDGECKPMLRRVHRKVPPELQGVAGITDIIAERTVHGPVVARGLIGDTPVAISHQRSTFMREADGTLTLLRLARGEADSAAKFREAFLPMNLTTNWTYVNDHEIAYFHGGLFPDRHPDIDPDFPVWGTGEWDWQQRARQADKPASATLLGHAEKDMWAPYRHANTHPHEENPERGFIVSWNNRVAPNWGSTDNKWDYTSLYRADMLEDRILAESGPADAPTPSIDAVKFTQMMEEAGLTDFRGSHVLPQLIALMEAVPPATAPSAREQQMLAILKDWVSDSQFPTLRRDGNRDDFYDNGNAVAIMDAWWGPVVDAVFGTADDGVPLGLDNAPGPTGSAYQSGFYGHVWTDITQILEVAGLAPAGTVKSPTSQIYCGNGDPQACSNALWTSLQAAGDAASQLQIPGSAPADWFTLAEPERIRFLGVAAFSMHWVNRPTYQQLLSFGETGVTQTGAPSLLDVLRAVSVMVTELAGCMNAGDPFACGQQVITNGLDNVTGTLVAFIGGNDPTGIIDECAGGAACDPQDNIAGFISDSAEKTPIQLPTDGLTADNPWPNRRILNISHRGGADEYPENTLFAYQKSLDDSGSDMIEADVYETADGELVVIHDETVDRTTNGTGSVSSFTLAELKALDAAHCFTRADINNPNSFGGANCGSGGPFPYRGMAIEGGPTPPADFSRNDFRIPTLRELLTRFPNTLINLELKPDPDSTGSYEGKLAAILAEFGRTDDVIVASFLDTASAAFKAQAPQVSTSVPTGQVALAVASGQGPLPGITVGHDAFQVPIDFSGVPVTNQEFVDDAHAQGLAVHVWTIDDPVTMRELLCMGVDGIMSDRPSVLRDVLAGDWQGTCSTPPTVDSEPTLAGCYEDARSNDCILKPLVDMLSENQRNACFTQGLSDGDCPVSLILNPIENGDPTETVKAVTQLLSDVVGCVAQPMLPTCRFKTEDCEIDPTGSLCTLNETLDVVYGLNNELGLPITGQRAQATFCDTPAGDPDPVSDQLGWQQRDLLNVICSMQRLTDQLAHPDFHLALSVRGSPRTYTYSLLEQLADPTRPRITLGQWTPGGRTTDPYRIEQDWAFAGRGRVDFISFNAASGARLVGRVFRPPVDVYGMGPYPSIVITTGSIQGYQEMYNWAAEGLAEAGYLVLSYDVQGQGRSETLPHTPDGNIDPGLTGVPFQQAYNFVQGTHDALNWLLSSEGSPYAEASGNTEGSDLYNPFSADVDRSRIGLAGHSLGASAVSQVAQERGCDPNPILPRDGCITAVVGWDSLSTVSAATPVRVPGLSVTSEYFFNPTPAQTSSPPDPETKLEAYKQMVSRGVDSMRVALRSSTHLESTYVPLILPASRYGERVMMHYTLAWFDRYIKNDLEATDRLTAQFLDASADASSIGAGTWDPVSGTNVPYRIEGDCVANRLSFYHRSAFSVSDPRIDPQALVNLENVRARGCGDDGEEPTVTTPVRGIAGCLLEQDPALCQAAIENLADLQDCEFDESGINCAHNALYDAIGLDTAATAISALITQCNDTPAAALCAAIRNTGDAPDSIVIASESVPRGNMVVSEVSQPSAATNGSKQVDGDPGDWTGVGPRIGGTSLYSAGEHIYTDFLFDAFGADDGDDARRLAVLGLLSQVNSRTDRADALQQAAGDQLGVPAPAGTSGGDHYGDAADREDGTDLTEVRWAADGSNLYLLARTAKLLNPASFVVLVLADTDDSASGMNGIEAGLDTRIFDRALVLTSTGGQLLDLTTGQPVAEPITAAVDAGGYRNALEASLPRSALERADGSIRVAVMTARRVGNGYVPANVAYRHDEPVTIYNERAQALSLFAGNVDGFAATIVLDDPNKTQTAVPGPGYHERQFISGDNISVENDPENGQLQPYGLFVPSTQSMNLQDQTRLTFWLHYRGGKAHSGAAWTPRLMTQLGEEQGNIVVTPRARGTSTWYTTRAHQDFFEVFADIAGTDLLKQYEEENLPADHGFGPTGLFNIDPARVYLSGYSMGGFATYLFGGLYPDLFAAGYSISGAVTQGAWTGVGPDAGQPGTEACGFTAPESIPEVGGGSPCFIEANNGRANAQLNYRILENTRYVPLVIHHGSNDELALTPGAERMGQRLLELQYRYDMTTFLGYEHFTQAIVDEWRDGAHFLNLYTRPENPRIVTYKVVPALVKAVNEVQLNGLNGGQPFDFRPDGAYWVDDLVVRDGADGSDPSRFGQIDAVSEALSANSHVPVPRTGASTDPAYLSTPVFSPGNHSTPYIRHGLDWLATGAEPTANRFSVDTTNVASASLDLARMALDIAQQVDGAVSSDGAVSLTFGNLTDPVRVFVNGVERPAAVQTDSIVLALTQVDFATGSAQIQFQPDGLAPPTADGSFERPGIVPLCRSLSAEVQPLCDELEGVEQQLIAGCVGQFNQSEAFCATLGGNLHGIIEACLENGGSTFCKIADTFLEGIASGCRQIPSAPPDFCALLSRERIAPDEISAYEASWTHRALSLQYELGAGLAFVDSLFPATHNSFNATEANFPQTLSGSDPNQRYTTVDQLRMGVRAIEVDVHWMPRAEGTGFGPTVCHGNAFHVGCTFEKSLEQELGDIRQWMNANPDQVIVLYLENNMDEPLDGPTASLVGTEQYAVAAQAINNTVGDLLYTPADHAMLVPGFTCNSGHPLEASINSLRTAGKRLYIHTEGCNAGWSQLVFNMNAGNRHTQGPNESQLQAFSPSGMCGGFDRNTHRTKWTRFFEDGTLVGALTAFSDGSLSTTDDIRGMVRCGVNMPSMDHVTPSDPRLPAYVWSWAPNQPQMDNSRNCAVYGADNRFHAADCSEEKPYACASFAMNAVGSRQVTWTIETPGGNWADATCSSGDLAVPRNGFENELLRIAKDMANVDEVWLNYTDDATEGEWIVPD